METSTGISIHVGESFPFYSDSGAECSVIKESVVMRFSGKRTIDIVVLRVIGNIYIKRTSQILSIVCINGFALQINFHVLADSYLKYDIVIDREFLSLGFDVISHKIASLCVKQK